MLRPEDIEKLFPQGLPTWIDKEVSLNPPSREDQQELPGKVYVSATLGKNERQRAYVFIKSPETIHPSEGGPFGRIDTAQDPMVPFNRNFGAKVTFRDGFLYTATGDLLPGTVVKFFVGYTDGPQYGMHYFITDQYAKVITLTHVDNEALKLSGRLRAMTDDEVVSVGLRIPRNAKHVPIVHQEG